MCISTAARKDAETGAQRALENMLSYRNTLCGVSSDSWTASEQSKTDSGYSFILTLKGLFLLTSNASANSEILRSSKYVPTNMVVMAQNITTQRQCPLVNDRNQLPINYSHINANFKREGLPLCGEVDRVLWGVVLYKLLTTFNHRLISAFEMANWAFAISS